MKKLFKKDTGQRGFTLIETLVAIFILTLAITATMTAAQAGLQSSLYARDQITAYYLAEEAMEYVRNIRDTNYQTTFNAQTENDPVCTWISNVGGPSECKTIPAECIGGTCRIDVPNNVMEACSGETCRLKYDEAAGYTYASGAASKFIRKINIEPMAGPTSAPTEIMVTVTMEWKTGPFDVRTFKVRSSLLDWALYR